MALANDKLFQMRTSEGWLSAIDDWRAKLRPMPSRSEAIRLLVEKGIEHWETPDRLTGVRT